MTEFILVHWSPGWCNGSNPRQAIDFEGYKNPQHAFLLGGGGIKAVGPMSEEFTLRSMTETLRRLNSRTLLENCLFFTRYICCNQRAFIGGWISSIKTQTGTQSISENGRSTWDAL
jgi:hypothetical protein